MFVTAPYPVNYEEDNWNLIAEFLQTDKRTQIPELTRAKVLHDAWNLAFAGELSFATALNMTLFLRSEKNHLVWDPVFTMIDHIDRHIWDIRDKFNVSSMIYFISILCCYNFLYQTIKRVKERFTLKNQ